MPLELARPPRRERTGIYHVLEGKVRKALGLCAAQTLFPDHDGSEQVARLAKVVKSRHEGRGWNDSGPVGRLGRQGRVCERHVYGQRRVADDTDVGRGELESIED